MLTSSTEHITEQIELYLDNLLSPEERWRVERHLIVCPSCSQHLNNARRLARELGPLLYDALGEPVPPVALRLQVRQKLYETNKPSSLFWRWTVPGRILNAAGTLVIIVLLAASALIVVQSYLPGASVLPRLAPLWQQEGSISSTSRAETSATATPTRGVQQITPSVTVTPLASRGDTLPRPIVLPPTEAAETLAPTHPAPTGKATAGEHQFVPAETGEDTPTPLGNNSQKLPGGTIAFSLFNPGRNVYEIHLINPDGSNHRLFSLAGVSEPALRRTEDGAHLLAYRAWSQPTSPRSLLSSNLEGEQPESIGGFWEDAQPDWSPTENRLIFASQRESDRRWRLYTIWGDGSAEVNLRREGKSPTFAPDGQRFAFESCDDTGNRCGLWIATLSDSEHGAAPFLQNPQAAAPDWSPVADKIAYMANRDGNWELYVIDLNNRQVRRLTDDPAVDGLPAWSPDGKWLAFISNRNENWGLWTLNIKSGQLNQVYSFEGGVYTPPVGDPYGERNWWDEQISWSE
jgi:hypothetical protein